MPPTSAPMATRSAFPASVDELMPAARDLASELGPDLSRNKVMKRLKIGDEKARQILGRLTEEAASTGETQPPAPAPTESDTKSLEQPEPEAKTEAVEPAAPDAATAPPSVRTLTRWPIVVLAAPAFVAIWSGWVGLGGLTGFGIVHPLPGIWDHLELNTAITLPIGVETYATYALWVWLTPGLQPQARRFARWSAIGSLILGAAGQVAYHLMVAAGMTSAPWQITTAVSCLPVAVVGMGAALYHLASRTDTTN